MSGAAFPAVRLAVEAMATRFELVLPLDVSGPGPVALRAAGEMALAEIVGAEDLLSVYRGTAQLAQVNARAGREAVPVSPLVFDLVQKAQEWSRRTGGAFDPTVGALVQFWRETPPTHPEWAPRMKLARESTGWRHVELNSEARTLRFHAPGLRLDLGSVGKGWALDRALEELREAGVTSALLHGGTSSVAALGGPPDADDWPIQLGSERPTGDGPDSTALTRSVVLLRDTTLSVSATWGRLHRDPKGGVRGHVLDPRTGEPVSGPRRAVVLGPSAAETDMLSTALLVAGMEGIPPLGDFGEGVRGWVEAPPDPGVDVGK